MKKYLYSIRSIINNDDLSWNEKYLAITGTHLSKSSCRKRLYGMRDLITALEEKRKLKPVSIEGETNLEYKQDGSVVSKAIIPVVVDENKNEAIQKMKSPKFLMKKHGYDYRLWKVTYSKSKISNIQQKGGRLVVIFSSELKVSPDEEINKELIKDFFEKTKINSPKVSKYYVKKYGNNNINNIDNPSTQNMLEVPIYDLHLARLCWVGDTGENFDISIAEDRYMYVINDIYKNYKNSKLSMINFIIGQDFFNYDNIQPSPSTVAGTPQDTDVRWKKMFMRGYMLMIKGLEYLSDGFKVPIKVIWVPGNHDETTSYYMLHVLNQRFRNNKNINLNMSGLDRKYLHYGNVGLGLAHTLKKKNMFSIFQGEAPVIWGNTKYREYHIGHKHTEIVRSRHGLKVRTIPSITGTDSWHYKNEFTCALKEAQTFLWNKENGLKVINYHKPLVRK